MFRSNRLAVEGSFIAVRPIIFLPTSDFLIKKSFENNVPFFAVIIICQCLCSRTWKKNRNFKIPRLISRARWDLSTLHITHPIRARKAIVCDIILYIFTRILHYVIIVRRACQSFLRWTRKSPAAGQARDNGGKVCANSSRAPLSIL